MSLKGNELVNCAPDGPKWTAQNITECRGGVGGAGGLILRLLTALNGRPRAMTSGGGWRRVRCEGL